MQHQQQPQQRGPIPPPQGFVGTGMPPPPQGAGRGPTAVAAAQARAAEEATRAAAEQMALEDAWKALHPDFRTPFAFVEDAVSRLLPYHVFADYEEDDAIDATAQKWEADMTARVQGFVEDFEKQVLTFNIRNQQQTAGFNRAEEQLIQEMALLEDERRQTERVRLAILQHQQQERHREQQEALRAQMAALAQAQAVGAWPPGQPVTSWQAIVAAARGEGTSSGVQAQAPAMMLQQQQQQQPPPQQETMMTAGAWQALAAAAAARGEAGSSEKALIQAVMMQHVQRRQRQQEMMAAVAASRGESIPGGQAAAAVPQAPLMQLMQQQQQRRQQQEGVVVAASRGEVAPGEQQQQLVSAAMIRQLQLMKQQHLMQQQQQQQQQEMMAAAGGWQLPGRQAYSATPRGDGSSSSQAALPLAVLQQQGHQGQASSAAAGMALPTLPWRGSSEGREQ